MFTSYLQLGIDHILDPNGLDHVLFVIVLALAYAISDLKKVVLLATAFTIGHSITLALAALNIVSVNAKFVEIAIAISIAITALLNLIPIRDSKMRYRYVVALLFGLIHGLGFSNFFRTILGSSDITIPLLAFNLGVELAQIIIILVVLMVSWLVVNKFQLKNAYWKNSISLIILLWSIKMIVERL